MSLVQSAKLHGHDPHAYLNDVLTRLPTHVNSRHRRTASASLAAPALTESRAFARSRRHVKVVRLAAYAA